MNLFIYFSVGLCFTCLMPAFFSSIKLFYLVPFMVRSFYVKPLSQVLWIALFTGLLLDMFSANTRFGMHSANYVITAFLTYAWKRHFFEDSLTTLPLMTYLFSLVSSVIQWVLILILDLRYIPLNPHFILTDFLLMPLQDTLFAFIVFTIPTYFLGKPTRKGSDYFLT